MPSAASCSNTCRTETDGIGSLTTVGMGGATGQKKLRIRACAQKPSATTAMMANAIPIPNFCQRFIWQTRFRNYQGAYFRWVDEEDLGRLLALTALVKFHP